MVNLIVYLINPILYFILSIDNVKYNKKSYYSFIILVCTYLGIINTCRIPDNDLLWYVESFKTAYGLSLIEYFPISGPNLVTPITDLGYLVYSWVLSNLTQGNIPLFIFITTFINYYILCVVAVKLGCFLKMRGSTIIMTIIFVSFFPWIYTMSIHLMRQFIAGTIMIYLLFQLLYQGSLIEYLKKNFIFILMMFLFHKSSLFFLVLFFLRFLDLPIRKGWMGYLFLFGGLMSYQIFASFLLPYVSAENAVHNVIERASMDNDGILGMMTLSKICLLFFIGLSVFILGYFTKMPQKYKGMKHVCNVILISVIFIILNIQQTELSNRFYFYVLPVIPYFLMFFLKIKPTNLYVKKIIIGINIIAWILYIFWGEWKYELSEYFPFLPLFLVMV